MSDNKTENSQENNTAPQVSAQREPRQRRTREQIIEAEQLKIEELEKKLAEKRERIEQLKTTLESKRSAKERKEENRKFLRFGKEVYRIFSDPDNIDLTQDFMESRKKILKNTKKDPDNKKVIAYYEDVVDIAKRAFDEAKEKETNQS